MSKAPSKTGAQRSRMWTRRAAGLALAVLASALLLEGTLRVLVYTDIAPIWRLRSAKLYADRWSDPLYFQLDQLWSGQPGLLPEKMADARLGWSMEDMDHDQFIAPNEGDLIGRRPVLLFGDSFISCMTDQDNCYEGWMERSALGATHRIYNYGVRGYGIDQIALLANIAVQHWRERNPIVVIGIYMDDDLDRAWLDNRGWPKPRFRLDEQGQLIEPGPLPSPKQYSKENPLWKHSLAWGWLLHGSGWLPTPLRRVLTGATRLELEKQRLSAALLTRLEANLSEAGVERFYVLFPGPERADTLEPYDWREKFLVEWLDSRRLPYVSMRRELLHAGIEDSRDPAEYYGKVGMLSGHLTPEGNRIAFRGLQRGIAREYDRGSWPAAPHPSELIDLDNEHRVRITSGWSKNFPDAADCERILLGPAGDKPARIGCELSRPARRFVTKVRLLPGSPERPTGSAQLEILVDHKSVFTSTFDTSEKRQDVEIDLYENREIEIRASCTAPGAPAGVLLLSKPRFQ